MIEQTAFPFRLASIVCGGGVMEKLKKWSWEKTFSTFNGNAK